MNSVIHAASTLLICLSCATFTISIHTVCVKWQHIRSVNIKDYMLLVSYYYDANMLPLHYPMIMYQ